MSDNLFSAIGGCGSSYLINQLRKRYIVGNKPDMFFNPLVKKLDVVIGPWEERFMGFKPDKKVTLFHVSSLDLIFPEYIAYLRTKKNFTAVFGLSAENRLFSKFHTENIVFQIRHPLHAYVSFGKPERHKDVTDFFGGIDSIESIEYYGTRWKAVCDEYLYLKKIGAEVHLIRFEFAHDDIKNIPDFRWIYEEFDTSKRNSNVLCERSENRLKDIVSDSYFQIYENWEI